MRLSPFRRGSGISRGRSAARRSRPPREPPALSKIQLQIAEANRFGIPAIVHEECLAGFTTWGATAYPIPLAWGATFNPAIVAEMGGRIGQSMRGVGIHQGLAPVLDVTVDARWGRTEETIGEDPYLVGVLASSYIRGLESSGIIATLKHFVGYSASRSARNLAPVSIGQRELADTLLLPFEMAVRESGVRSVMHSYASIDGVPAASSRALLTDLLREAWGFSGTVVADYFGIGFLKLLHHVAGTWGEAGALAPPRGGRRRASLAAGIRPAPDRRGRGGPARRGIRRPGGDAGPCGRRSSLACSTLTGARRAQALQPGRFRTT
ncbi:MAG: glycoside hydrolase family 3 N-terminal domain-containing protein [Galbitalea sp.]